MKRWVGMVLGLSLLVEANPGLALDLDYNGHLRGQVSGSYHHDDDLLSRQNGERSFLDGSVDFRLNAALFMGEQVSFDLAYEAALAGGDTRQAVSGLAPDDSLASLFQPAVPSDEQQFFSLTHVFRESDSSIGYHRLDRLFLTVDSSHGTTSLGRQALTWGNGLTFNPMDLVNPFAPSDIIRDYKVGADMVLYQTGAETITDFQLVYVPRRNIETGDLSWEESTFGAKFRVQHERVDYDFLGVKNYEDLVLGSGLSRYLGEGVFRTDVTLTFLSDDPDRDYYFSAVANLDYSWVWDNKNWYGFVELYYNGLGADSTREALQDKALVERLLRGELFVTGRIYADGMLQYEMHPLFNCFLSAIVNLEDGSFLLQPRAIWDFSQSSQLLFGLNLPVGGAGTEFGSFDDPESGTVSSRTTQVYALLTWFF
jgi:hypothetical protein